MRAEHWEQIIPIKSFNYTLTRRQLEPETRPRKMDSAHLLTLEPSDNLMLHFNTKARQK